MSVFNPNSTVGVGGKIDRQSQKQSIGTAIDWTADALQIYSSWNRGPSARAVMNTVQVGANAYDRENAQANKADPSVQRTNAGQVVGTAVGTYNTVDAFNRGDNVRGTTSAVQTGLQGYQAYNQGIANAATDATVKAGAQSTASSAGQAAGAVGVAVGGYNAIEQYKAGNTDGAAVSGVQAGAGAAEMAGVTGAAGAGVAIGGAYMAAKGWGTGDTTNGVIAGSMMLYGAYLMAAGPVGWVAAGVLAVASVIGNSCKTGKHEDQNDRDDIREGWQREGFLVDKDYNVTLADGSLFNIGLDGHSGEHDATRPEMLTEKSTNSTGKLHSYDVDYTNDLDFVSAMGGVSLTRLLKGGKAKNIDQIGNQLGNAALSSVGYNQEMTQENFDKVQANMRALYSKAGIKSKDSVYQLANAAFAEGKITEADLIGIHQAANMMFDEDGYTTAKALMSGRNDGVKQATEAAAAEEKAPASPTANAVNGEQQTPGATAPDMTGMENQPLVTPGDGADVRAAAEGVASGAAAAKASRTSRMTKEQIQAQNEARYATQEARA